MRKRPITLEEKALWKAVNVTSKKIQPSIEEAVDLDENHTKSTSSIILPSIPLTIPPRKRTVTKQLQLDDTTVMDKRNATRLRRGEFNIDGTLDLHGQTSTIAHNNLLHFIDNSYATQKRCLLVITGKGRRSAEEGGILKKQLPLWLASSTLQNKILAVTSAHAKDGGSGAFYVLLRRQRDT